VWKKYGNKDVVKGLNLALKPNECFGLLGSNGAGKTTTFRMLTGDIKNSIGDIYVCGVNVNNNREKVSATLITFLVRV
jgi:ABC-type multidrug transport system ATPase subunit